MQYTIQFQTDHLERSLAAVRHEFASPHVMLAGIGEALLRVNTDRHEKGQAPDGTPWKPLAAGTIASQAWSKQGKDWREKKATSVEAGRKAASRRILYQHGDLLRFHYQVAGAELFIGTNDHKAAWHHFGTGTHGPKGKPYVIKPINKKALAFAGHVVKRVNHPGIPARPLAGYPAADEQLVKEVSHDHLTAVLKAVR